MSEEVVFDEAKWQAQVERVTQFRARLLDQASKEAWIKQQFAEAEDQADYDNWNAWMSAHSQELEEGWYEHCEPFVPETVPSPDCCGG